MKRSLLLGIALTCLTVAAPVAATAQGPATPPPAAAYEVHDNETILTFPARQQGTGDVAPDLGAVVALPADATGAEAVLISGRAATVVIASEVMRMRGQAAVVVQVREPGSGPVVVAVRHNGSWAAKSSDRLSSAALAASLPGQPDLGLKAGSHPLGGSYVIVVSPQYASAVAPLADWKLRKGWPVVTVTTDVTGSTNAGIKAWLQEAYDTWQRPPEYVLLVGDVDVIPSWDFSGNVTDMPYALLDGDDWLPDVMLGRFSVSNQTECQAMVAKTVAYEQAPYIDQTAWFTRSVMVAGQYASTTPMYTVQFCGEQLESIGFDPLDPVTPMPGDEGNYIVSPLQPREGLGIPQDNGPAVIKTSIDEGCSFVVYRGWAYGTAGWQPPTYTVDHIPALANGQMLPVVMSFVCLNGDFSGSEACFGEVFTRQGSSSPESFRGAVAFIGNGEHWSHTRFNDAMAIGFFERIVEPEINTLGALLNAGKLRFMEYYPGELNDTGNEESVEFYFHIYNLLGDPELNFYRAAPTALQVTHEAEIPVGASFLELTVREEGGAVLPGARIGVAQNGQLLGAAFSDDAGQARVALSTPVGEGAVSLTVTHPDRQAYSTLLNADLSEIYVALESLAIDDEAPAGNGDGQANPGETLALTTTMRNVGSEAAAAATVTLTIDGPATVTNGSASLAGLAAGASGVIDTPLELVIASDAPDGALVTGRLAIAHDGAIDLAGFELSITAPSLQITASSEGGGEGWLDPGQATDLMLTLVNQGSLATTGGELALSLQAPVGVTLQTSSVTFGAMASGESTTAGPISLTVADDVAEGATVTLAIQATMAEGTVIDTTVPLPIGKGGGGEPAGPDNHGYYAYDSADYLYPAQRPVYRWLEISTTYGGPGTQLEYNEDNYDRDVIVDLPFPFTFYGEDFTQIRVSDNGWISFEATNDDYNFYNWPIPSTHGNGALIAPFWDNFIPVPPSYYDPDVDPIGTLTDGIFYYHDTDNDEFIVEWSRMRHYKAGNPEDEDPDIIDRQTFQAVLRNPATYATPSGDGEILFFYKQVADNDFLRMWATVGIESPDETDGLQLTYDGVRSAGTMVFGPGSAIRVTTAAPVRVPLVVDKLERQARADGARLTWTYSDPRPVIGWQVYADHDGHRTCLTEEPLAAGVRTSDLTCDPACDLILEALLPGGVACDAGKALSGTPTAAFALGQPHPNPVRGESSISFALPRSGHVQLRIFDVRGRLVRTLLDGRAEAGDGLVVWQGRDDRGRQLADGVYFYRLEHAGQSLTRKLLLVR